MVKAFADFYTDRKARDGRRPECKACNLAKRAAKYRENPRPYIERALKWQRENKERYEQRQREYVQSGKKSVASRKSYLKRTYGITVEQYDTLLAAQSGLCAICGSAGRDDISLHVDHDHATGAIRGLLCFRCNNALGDFDDDSARFYAAAEYLDRDDELAEAARTRARTLSRSGG
jgi:hypothetical protein